VKSTPTTWPDSPTWRAAQKTSVPEPEPRSSTFSPGASRPVAGLLLVPSPPLESDDENSCPPPSTEDALLACPDDRRPLAPEAPGRLRVTR
jgi:hypothetical protein